MDQVALVKVSFAGVFPRPLDDKNRVTVPSDWRNKGQVDEIYFVPKGDDRCLLVMTVQEFARVSANGEKLEETEPIEADKFLRHFHASARVGAPDSHGRLVLPADYCQRFDLKDEVVLVGNSGRFEIWNSARWSEAVKVEQPGYQRSSARFRV